MTQQRIFWSKEELALVLEHAWAIHSDDKSLTQESVFRTAQQVLPAARQRPIHSSAVSQFWVKMLKKYGTKHAQPHAAAPTATSAPEPVPEAAPTVTQQPSVVTAAPEPVREYDTTLGIADLLEGMVLSVLYSPQIRAALRSMVAETLAPETDLEQIQAITWREPKAQRERMLRVVVAGGGGSFHNELRGIPRVDFRFWGAYEQESVHRLKAILQNADVAVVMTNYIGHNPFYIIKAREKAGKLRTIYWEGRNAAELRARIIELVQTSEPPPQSPQAH